MVRLSFDPSGMTLPMGRVRLGTGRDATDVSFATIFGTVQSSPPWIAIEGIEDAANGVGLAYACVDTLSTDGDRAARHSRSLADSELGQMAAIDG